MQNTDRLRMKFKQSPLYIRLFLLLGWVIPSLVFIVQYMFVRGFIPADNFLSPSIYTAALVAAGMAIIVIPKMLADERKNHPQGGIRFWAKATFIVIGMPLFSSFPFFYVLSNTLPYALHLGSSPQLTTIVEPVIRTSYGSGSCHSPAILKGDSFLLHRRVCNLQPEDNRSLEHGGTIELQAYSSPYGLQIERYRVLTIHD